MNYKRQQIKQRNLTFNSLKSFPHMKHMKAYETHKGRQCNESFYLHKETEITAMAM